MKLAIRVACLTLLNLVTTFMIVGLVTSTSANESERVRIEQIGTSQGVPAVRAVLENGNSISQYTIVIRNPDTNETISKRLDNKGKEAEFVVNHFTDNGTYAYVLNSDGATIAEGGVNLVSENRAPNFTATIAGEVIKVTVSNGVDFVGQTIFIKTGNYTNNFQLESPAMETLIRQVKGAGSTITFSSQLKDLTTVPLEKVSSNGEESTVAEEPSSSTTNTEDVAAETNTPTQPVSNSRQLKINLNKNSYKKRDMITATVDVIDQANANKSLTIRLGADDNSSTALVHLDQNGKGTSIFKFMIPQPSSKSVSVTTYTISGSRLDYAETSYQIEDEAQSNGFVSPSSSNVGGNSGSGGSGGNGGKEESKVAVEYVSLDLREIEQGKALLAWYGAENLDKNKTKLKIINSTTKESHIYSVYMPNGDSAINLKVANDGPGIYNWELYHGNDKVVQSEFGTAVGDGAPLVSQDGLPVIKAVSNKSLYQTHTEGVDPNIGSAEYIGEEVGAVVADDFTDYDYSNANAEAEARLQLERDKEKKLLIVAIAVGLLLLLIVIFIIMKKRKGKSKAEPEQQGFKEYEEEEVVESKPPKGPKFEEVG